MAEIGHGARKAQDGVDLALYSAGDIVRVGLKPNWVKDFPVVGQGTLIFSIERNSPFYIFIRPKLDAGQPGADEWIALGVHKDRARFTMFLEGVIHPLKEVRGEVNHESVGYEEGRKISYWFSYNRDLLTLKYGKGYRMTETTLMTHDFLDGIVGKDDQMEIRKKLQYLFSPETRKRIEQYDVEPREQMIEQYTQRIKRFRGAALAAMFAHHGGDQATALDRHLRELAKSVIDIEGMVAFDKAPFVCNWSPFVLDSSRLNLFELDSSQHTFSASLPSACLELYSNVTAKDVDLDWSPSPEKYRLSDAIRYSLKRPNGILYKKLESKTGEFGSFEQTYLRVTLGKTRGSSPGIPYVLEIWPMGHGSPIHNHGNSYAVIKVLHGGLTIKVFNKQTDHPEAQPLQKFDVKKGDITWISPNWFQTHQLWNYTSDYCATIQCYQYGNNDLTEWPYFDYVADTAVIDEFLPDSDFTFHEMQRLVLKEFQDHMDNQ